MNTHERIAAEFHAAYERNAVDLDAVSYGPETAWDEVPLKSRTLLVATINDLIRDHVIAVGPMAFDELRAVRGVS